MAQIFFTSDQHFGHKNIIRFCDRPFATIEEMNRAMIDNWNAVVSEEDVVWCLGDFAYRWGITHVQSTVQSLKGHKHLIVGNHDRKIAHCYPEMGFESVTQNGRIERNGRTWRMSHYPYVGDPNSPYEDRFKDLRLKDEGEWLLHGHVHQHWKQRGRMINVGVDIWGFTPVSLDEIEKLCYPPTP
jgi:calcineurin-like phosphoesterase family protein